MLIDSVFKIVELALGLWADKEKNKYLDKHQRLKMEWYAEYNKKEEERSDAVLDNILFEYSVLCDSLTSRAGKPNP